MNASDRNWELAGLARQDGDRAAERLYTNRARGWPDDYVPPASCVQCGKSGVGWYPGQDLHPCTWCNGTGREDGAGPITDGAYRLMRPRLPLTHVRRRA